MYSLIFLFSGHAKITCPFMRREKPLWFYWNDFHSLHFVKSDETEGGEHNTPPYVFARPSGLVFYFSKGVV